MSPAATPSCRLKHTHTHTHTHTTHTYTYTHTHTHIHTHARTRARASSSSLFVTLFAHKTFCMIPSVCMNGVLSLNSVCSNKERRNRKTSFRLISFPPVLLSEPQYKRRAPQMALSQNAADLLRRLDCTEKRQHFWVRLFGVTDPPGTVTARLASVSTEQTCHLQQSTDTPRVDSHWTALKSVSTEQTRHLEQSTDTPVGGEP
jgi:hypothetical protein